MNLLTGSKGLRVIGRNREIRTMEERINLIKNTPDGWKMEEILNEYRKDIAAKRLASVSQRQIKTEMDTYFSKEEKLQIWNVGEVETYGEYCVVLASSPEEAINKAAETWIEHFKGLEWTDAYPKENETNEEYVRRLCGVLPDRQCVEAMGDRYLDEHA